MQKHKIFYILPVFIGLILLFNSCKTKKQIFHFSNIRPMRAVKLYDNIEFNKLRFKTLSVKFSATYEKDGDSQSFGGAIRIKNDSLIWISIVPALGIEAARIFITKDSIKFINRINSTYYIGNYSYLQSLLNLEIDFKILQSVLTNELFLYSRSAEDEDNAIRGYKSSVDSNLYVIQSLRDRKVNRKLKKNKTNDLILEEISVIPVIFKISRVCINDFEYQKSLDLIYTNFNTFDEQMVPQNLDFKIKDKNKQINVSIEYTKITINKELEYPFSIPEKYKRTLE
ncbi:MAG: DUF4292 domain-containing protein [Bacteroidia bacterium]|nr:DUF4292 domain-containing protein [Bacteroidia bacterium]